MDLKLRPGTLEDADECGQIFYEAFSSLYMKHGFELGLPGREAGVARVRSQLSNPGIYGVVAEVGGRVMGSNFLDERCAVFGVGPITVDPQLQDGSVGR